MKNKIHYIITVLLTITCGYLTYQQIGIKKYLEVQSEILNKQQELNDVQGRLNNSLYNRRTTTTSQVVSFD